MNGHVHIFRAANDKGDIFPLVTGLDLGRQFRLQLGEDVSGEGLADHISRLDLYVPIVANESAQTFFNVDVIFRVLQRPEVNLRIQKPPKAVRAKEGPRPQFLHSRALIVWKPDDN